MMLPAATCSPPKIFRPSRWLLESRPLRDEPPAFLCAITSVLQCCYLIRLCDEIITVSWLYLLETLLSALFASVRSGRRGAGGLFACRGFRGPLGLLLLARLLLARLGAVGEDLRHPHEREFLPVAALAPRVLAAAFLEGDDFRPAPLLQHLGGDRGARHGRSAERDGITAHHQHVAELDDLAGLAPDLIDLEHILGGNAVLLAAGADDCEHRFSPRVRSRCSDQWSGPASCSRFG